MSKSETPQWLREALKHHLAGVRAPEGLWERVEAGRDAENLPPHWTRWAVAAVITVATAAGTYWLPRPAMRTDVSISAVSGQADLRRNQPAQWDLQCAPPANRAAFQVADLAVRRGHPVALAGLSCQACHSTGLNQHHL